MRDPSYQTLVAPELAKSTFAGKGSVKKPKKVTRKPFKKGKK